jgi:hypothetical protein
MRLAFKGQTTSARDKFHKHFTTVNNDCSKIAYVFIGDTVTQNLHKVL